MQSPWALISQVNTIVMLVCLNFKWILYVSWQVYLSFFITLFKKFILTQTYILKITMSIFEILNFYRTKSKTEREKGTYFENLIKVFLENDERFSDQFSKIETYSKWAISQGRDAKDIGIDLIATNKDDSLSAIQCKFYDEDNTISKSDIDSFFSASDSNIFTRRVLIDSTRKALGNNTLKTIENYGNNIKTYKKL